MHYAKRRFLTNRFRRFDCFNMAETRRYNFSRYFGANLNKCSGMTKEKPKCSIYWVAYNYDFEV